jgi:hypothetical protein
MTLCSQGVRTIPFAEGLRLGGIRQGGTLFLAVESERPWKGRLCFDGPRNEHAGAKSDWARVNEVPQWFVVQPKRRYQVVCDSINQIEVQGQQLINGLEMGVRPGKVRKIRVQVIK